MHGLHVTLVVSAGLLLAGAVMALKLPRAMECAEPEAEPVRLPAQAAPDAPRIPAPVAPDRDAAARPA